MLVHLQGRRAQAPPEVRRTARVCGVAAPPGGTGRWLGQDSGGTPALRRVGGGSLHPSPQLGGSVGFTATFKMTVSQDSALVCLRVHLENCLLKPWGIFQKCVPQGETH